MDPAPVVQSLHHSPTTSAPTKCFSDPQKFIAPPATRSHVVQRRSPDPKPGIESKPPPASIGTSGSGTCYNCGWPGHWAQSCPHPRLPKSDGYIHAPASNSVQSYDFCSRREIGQNASQRFSHNTSTGDVVAPSSNNVLADVSHTNWKCSESSQTPSSAVRSGTDGPTDSEILAQVQSHRETTVASSSTSRKEFHWSAQRTEHDSNSIKDQLRFFEEANINPSSNNANHNVEVIDVTDLDYPGDFCVPTENVRESCIRASKPLAATMEFADLEAPLPIAMAGNSKCVSKYFHTCDTGLSSKNVKETPLWHMYCSDPIFCDIPNEGGSVAFEELIARRENLVLQSNSLNIRNLSARLVTNEAPMVEVQPGEKHLEREREEKLARLGVTGQPKPVVPVHLPARKPTQLISTISTISTTMEEHEVVTVNNTNAYYRHTRPGSVHDDIHSATTNLPASNSVPNPKALPMPPSPPPITPKDHPALGSSPRKRKRKSKNQRACEARSRQHTIHQHGSIKPSSHGHSTNTRIDPGMNEQNSVQNQRPAHRSDTVLTCTSRDVGVIRQHLNGNQRSLTQSLTQTQRSLLDLAQRCITLVHSVVGRAQIYHVGPAHKLLNVISGFDSCEVHQTNHNGYEVSVTGKHRHLHTDIPYTTWRMNMSDPEKWTVILRPDLKPADGSSGNLPAVVAHQNKHKRRRLR